MENLVVGQKVILNRAMMDEKAGSVGYVVDTYKDFDIEGRVGAMIIFQEGSYDGFSAKEQDLYLQVKRVDQRYSSYVFHNVLQLSRDYDNGYWEF